MVYAYEMEVDAGPAAGRAPLGDSFSTNPLDILQFCRDELIHFDRERTTFDAARQRFEFQLEGGIISGGILPSNDKAARRLIKVASKKRNVAFNRLVVRGGSRLKTEIEETKKQLKKTKSGAETLALQAKLDDLSKQMTEHAAQTYYVPSNSLVLVEVSEFDDEEDEEMNDDHHFAMDSDDQAEANAMIRGFLDGDDDEPVQVGGAEHVVVSESDDSDEESDEEAYMDEGPGARILYRHDHGQDREVRVFYIEEKDILVLWAWCGYKGEFHQNQELSHQEVFENFLASLLAFQGVDIVSLRIVETNIDMQPTIYETPVNSSPNEKLEPAALILATEAFSPSKKAAVHKHDVMVHRKLTDHKAAQGRDTDYKFCKQRNHVIKNSTAESTTAIEHALLMSILTEWGSYKNNATFLPVKWDDGIKLLTAEMEGDNATNKPLEKTPADQYFDLMVGGQLLNFPFKDIGNIETGASIDEHLPIFLGTSALCLRDGKKGEKFPHSFRHTITNTPDFRVYELQDDDSDVIDVNRGYIKAADKWFYKSVFHRLSKGLGINAKIMKDWQPLANDSKELNNKLRDKILGNQGGYYIDNVQVYVALSVLGGQPRVRRGRGNRVASEMNPHTNAGRLEQIERLGYDEDSESFRQLLLIPLCRSIPKDAEKRAGRLGPLRRHLIANGAHWAENEKTFLKIFRKYKKAYIEEHGNEYMKALRKTIPRNGFSSKTQRASQSRDAASRAAELIEDHDLGDLVALVERIEPKRADFKVVKTRDGKDYIVVSMDLMKSALKEVVGDMKRDDIIQVATASRHLVFDRVIQHIRQTIQQNTQMWPAGLSERLAAISDVDKAQYIHDMLIIKHKHIENLLPQSKLEKHNFFAAYEDLNSPATELMPEEMKRLKTANVMKLFRHFRLKQLISYETKKFKEELKLFDYPEKLEAKIDATLKLIPERYHGGEVFKKLSGWKANISANEQHPDKTAAVRFFLCNRLTNGEIKTAFTKTDLDQKMAYNTVARLEEAEMRDEAIHDLKVGKALAFFVAQCQKKGITPATITQDEKLVLEKAYTTVTGEPISEDAKETMHKVIQHVSGNNAKETRKMVRAVYPELAQDVDMEIAEAGGAAAAAAAVDDMEIDGGVAVEEEGEDEEEEARFMRANDEESGSEEDEDEEEGGEEAGAAMEDDEDDSSSSDSDSSSSEEEEEEEQYDDKAIADLYARQTYNLELRTVVTRLTRRSTTKQEGTTVIEFTHLDVVVLKELMKAIPTFIDMNPDLDITSDELVSNLLLEHADKLSEATRFEYDATEERIKQKLALLAEAYRSATPDQKNVDKAAVNMMCMMVRTPKQKGEKRKNNGGDRSDAKKPASSRPGPAGKHSKRSSVKGPVACGLVGSSGKVKDSIDSALEKAKKTIKTEKAKLRSKFGIA